MLTTSLATSIVLHLGVFAVLLGTGFSAAQFGASQPQVIQIEFVAVPHEVAAESEAATDRKEPEPEVQREVHGEVHSEVKKLSLKKSQPRSKRSQASVSAPTGVQPGPSTLNDPNARAAVAASPNYLNNPPPRYPESARRAHIEGLVLLLVQVSAEGTAEHVELHRSSGSSALDRAAREAVAKWNFSPARIGGIAVSSQVQVPVRFELRKGR